MKKCAVILGAGASAGVSLGHFPVNEAWSPPLAKDLFDIASHEDYAPILLRYPGAMSLAPQLGEYSRRGAEFKLEEELRRFAEHEDVTTRNNYRQIPFYLRDLIGEVCEHYTKSPEAYSVLVRTLLAEQPHAVAFITLNYDTFLERALQLHDRTFTFHDPRDYVDERRSAIVVKVHGSIDWWADVGSARVGEWETAVARFDVHGRRQNLILNSNPVRQGPEGYSADGRWMYPLLTAPLAGKGPHSVVCPELHVEVLKHFLEDCSKFLVIGTSGLDDDLLELLAAAARPSVLTFVGGDDVPAVAQRFRDAVPQFARGGGGSCVSERFDGFIRSGGLDNFARA